MRREVRDSLDKELSEDKAGGKKEWRPLVGVYILFSVAQAVDGRD